MDKKQREERRHQEDIALQRGLLWVVGAIVLEALLVLVNRFYINFHLTDSEMQTFLIFDQVLRVVRIAAPVAVVLAILWTAWQLKQGKKFALQLVVTIALAAVGLCAHVTVKFQASGMSMLFWLVIAWAVLAMVYYINQREFFLGASACGMSVLGLWFVRYGAAARLEALLLLAAVAAVGAVALLMKKSDGVLPGSKSVQFLPAKTSYTVLLASCLASLVAMVVALLAGGTVAYYLVYVMIAWLFALFVYYTVKLM